MGMNIKCCADSTSVGIRVIDDDDDEWEELNIHTKISSIRVCKLPT